MSFEELPVEMKEKPKVKRVNKNTRNGNILKKPKLLIKKNKKSDRKK